MSSEGQNAGLPKSGPDGGDDKNKIDAAKIATAVGVVIAAGIGISYLQNRRNKDRDLIDDAEDSFDDFGNKVSRKVDQGKRFAQRKGDEAKWQVDDSRDQAKWSGYNARDRAQAESDNIGEAARDAADETKGFFKRTKAKADEKIQDVKESAKDTGNKIQNKAKEAGDKTKKALRTHPVQKGDTLYSLARKYKVPVETIKRSNNLWGNEIRPGDELYIPGLDGK